MTFGMYSLTAVQHERGPRKPKIKEQQTDLKTALSTSSSHPSSGHHLAHSPYAKQFTLFDHRIMSKLPPPPLVSLPSNSDLTDTVSELFGHHSSGKHMSGEHCSLGGGG